MARKQPKYASEAERRQKVLDKMKAMTSRQVFEAAVKAGIYTPDGKLTPPYRSGRKSRVRLG